MAISDLVNCRCGSPERRTVVAVEIDSSDMSY